MTLWFPQDVVSSDTWRLGILTFIHLIVDLMVPQSPHLWTPEASVSPWMYNQDEYTYWIGRALVLIIWPVDVCNNGRRIQLKAPWNFLLSDKLVNQKQYCIPNRSTKWQRPKHIDRSDVIYFKPIYLTSLYSFLLKKQKKKSSMANNSK